MKIAIFADHHRNERIQNILNEPLLQRIRHQCKVWNDYDEFITELPQSGCRVMIVARDGAAGMESARAARILMPDVPLIWFSDDKGFGPESYRVGCSYFAAGPITPELMKNALTSIYNQQSKLGKGGHTI